jgi:hypothetical protein
VLSGDLAQTFEPCSTAKAHGIKTLWWKPSNWAFVFGNQPAFQDMTHSQSTKRLFSIFRPFEGRWLDPAVISVIPRQTDTVGTTKEP